MKNFAKVFYGKDHDFLCQKIYDEDDEKYGISISVELDLATASHKILITNEEERDEIWEKMVEAPIEAIEASMQEAIEKTEGLLELMKGGE